jgi:hypothetical protein
MLGAGLTARPRPAPGDRAIERGLAENVASRRVVEANGGELVERFSKPAADGGAESLRFRILPAPRSGIP